jgi:hypothetical protein
MQDQAENDARRRVATTRLPVAKAGIESLPEIQPCEEQLKQEETGVGGELLVFEPEQGNGERFTLDLISAKLHGERSSMGWECFLAKLILSTRGPLFNQKSCNARPHQG